MYYHRRTYWAKPDRHAILVRSFLFGDSLHLLGTSVASTFALGTQVLEPENTQPHHITVSRKPGAFPDRWIEKQTVRNPAPSLGRGTNWATVIVGSRIKVARVDVATVQAHVGTGFGLGLDCLGLDLRLDGLSTHIHHHTARSQA